MRRDKFIHGKLDQRTPAAETGQLWRSKYAKPNDRTLLILGKADGVGFRAMLSNGSGDHINHPEILYKNYDYIGIATLDQVEEFETEFEKHNGLSLAI